MLEGGRRSRQASMNAKQISTSHVSFLLLLCAVVALGLQSISSPALLDDLDQGYHVRSFTSLKQCIGLDCYGFFRPVKNLLFFSRFAGLPFIRRSAIASR